MTGLNMARSKGEVQEVGGSEETSAIYLHTFQPELCTPAGL